ncbi:hypothetical protein [Marinobacterium jannaschii]|uniref:hypothetical protein n=1 Tax=Marinobacterium jannaschii TaxID=64970 RepID=UPI000485F144|nr:hypothetical protein [Marinobacterium jannaschii]
MLITISDNLSVQRFNNPHNTQWTCFGHFDQSENHKRRSWKKMTGLMSTDAMHSWLDKNYPETDHASHFRNIPQK